MAKLGFIGLGVMGGNMVARLLEKGHSVTGYNRTHSKAQWLIARAAEFLRDLAAASAICSDASITLKLAIRGMTLSQKFEGTRLTVMRLNGLACGLKNESAPNSG